MEQMEQRQRKKRINVGISGASGVWMGLRLLDQMPEAVRPQLQAVKLIVPSMRLDVVIAKLYHLSRSQSISLFREKKIFVNGRGQENNSGLLKETDVVSVRGYGRFICDGVSGETKKGNLNIQVSKYV